MLSSTSAGLIRKSPNVRDRYGRTRPLNVVSVGDVEAVLVIEVELISRDGRAGVVSIRAYESKDFGSDAGECAVVGIPAGYRSAEYGRHNDRIV